MKKTWFLAVLSIVFCTNAFGAGICGGREISFQGIQTAMDNEFIYTSKSAHNSASNILHSGKGAGTLKSGYYYECDNEQGCGHGTLLLTTSNTVFQGSTTGNLKLYKCDTSGGDSWVSMRISACTTFPTGQPVKVVDLGGRGTQIFHVSAGYCYLTGSMAACFAAKKRGEPANWNGTSCNCGDNHIWDEGKKKCIQNATTMCPEGSSPSITSSADCNKPGTSYQVITEFKCIKEQGGKCICGQCVPKTHSDTIISPTPQPRKTCREQRTTLNGKACCDTLSLGVYKKATDTCECKNGMTFVIENGTGYCRPSNATPSTKYECDSGTLAQITQWKIKCVKNADIIALIAQIEAYCAGANKTSEMFMTYYNTLLQYNPAQCGQVSQDVSQQTENINSAYSQLTAIHNKFRDEVSVWKDAEGNFNTARLASDSIAGVVLGTTGALVTSHVVKKNQVEEGFEDIKCTIGGQNVAEWGDEFRVGIQ